jgi:hypothetical protein
MRSCCHRERRSSRLHRDTRASRPRFRAARLRQRRTSKHTPDRQPANAGSIFSRMERCPYIALTFDQIERAGRGPRNCRLSRHPPQKLRIPIHLLIVTDLVSVVNHLYGCEPAHTTYCGLKSITTRISKAFCRGGGKPNYFMMRTRPATAAIATKASKRTARNASQSRSPTIVQRDRPMDCRARGSSALGSGWSSATP